MKYNKLNRRFFLQGLGGSLLSLPILPSLIPAKVYAATPAEKFLVMLGSAHGGVGDIGDWNPQSVMNINSPLLSKYTLFPSGSPNNIDHIIHHARLANLTRSNPGHAGGNVDNNQARTSFILGSFLNPYINKMNLYRGIDGGTFYSGHSRGMYSGNLKAAVNGSTSDMVHWKSLDQFLADSGKFYNSTASNSLKIVTISDSISHLEDGTRLPRTESRIDRLYNAIFDKYSAEVSPAEIASRDKRSYLIDRVHEDYKRFVKGAYGPARQMSSVDKSRVEEHISRLTDVEKKYKNFVNSCSSVTGPRENLVISASIGVRQVERAYDLFTDLIASAFSCGATRMAGASMLENVSEAAGRYTGDYHQDVAHKATNDPAAQLRHNESYRWQSKFIVAPLVSKMDAISLDGQSGSILDNGLVMWTHECGPRTHGHADLGFVTFGSLGNHFKTGNYVDFRNHKNTGLNGDVRPGIPIQRMWANIVQGFGFTPAEYERNGRPGYGDSSYNPFDSRAVRPYPPRIMNSLSDKLPIVT